MARPIKEDKQPLPPKLNCYWKSVELRDEVEDFILKQQVAGKLPRRNSRGQRYGVSNFVMEAIEEHLARLKKK